MEVVMTGSTDTKQDKRRRGPRIAVLPDAKGDIKRSFYVNARDYKTFTDGTGGDVSKSVPLAMTAWLALDGNVQEFIRKTKEGRTMQEAVAILKERLPEKMADMLLAQYVASLPLDRKANLVREARKKT